MYIKVVYDHFKKFPGKTLRQVTVALTPYAQSHHYSTNSISGLINALKAVGLLKVVYEGGKRRDGKYYVTAPYDAQAVAKFYRDQSRAQLARKQLKLIPKSSAPAQASLPFSRPVPPLQPQAGTSISRDVLRDLTRRYARAQPYNLPGSQLVHQSLYDLCLILNVKVTGA